MLGRYAAFRFYKNRALKALLIGDALVLTASAMLTPIYAVFVQGVGGDLLDAGITASALAFGSAIASLIAGRYADSLRDKKSLVVLGYAITGLGFLLFTTVNSVWYLAIVQLMIGLVRAFAEPAFDALYSVHLDKKREAEEWGAWEGMSYFVGGLGALFGGLVVSYFSFNTLFLTMAALCAVSAFYMLRVPQRTL
ncbi:MAG TPA: MFS transporter [Candidatus Pristimantibacillus sp.]|nr:MFS transporter [Candidatus Pristimantibacillus sp.]